MLNRYARNKAVGVETSTYIRHFVTIMLSYNRLQITVNLSKDYLGNPNLAI